MRLNTLVFDANLPTVQQVNVPTNSDYKVGMKVKRNGNVQSIKPSEFTITSEDGTTLSADPDKTNGYVTITKASGDNASFKQYGVHIDHGYDFNDYVKQTGFMTNTLPVNFPNTTTAESLGIGGYTLTMDNAAWGFKKSTTGAVDVADITSWTTPMTYVSSGWVIFKWANGNPAVWYGYDNVNGHYMAAQDADGTNIRKVDDITIDPSWILSMGTNGLKGTMNNYYVIAYNFQFGTPFSADFKLNINEFKSQSGDIAETLADNPTVKVDGTYADGTNFSFDFCTK